MCSGPGDEAVGLLSDVRSPTGAKPSVKQVVGIGEIQARLFAAARSYFGAPGATSGQGRVRSSVRPTPKRISSAW